MELIFLLFFGAVILPAILSAAARRKQAEAQKQSAQVQQSDPARPQPVQPVRAAQTVRTAQSTQARPATQMVRPAPATQTVTQNARPSAASAEAAYEKNRAQRQKQTEPPAEEPSTLLPPWGRDALVQGIVYAEILGKPKALRH